MPFPASCPVWPRLQLEFAVYQVGEFDSEAVGAAAFVAEVDLAQGLGGDPAELVVGEAGFLGLEETGGVLGRQGEREVAYAGRRRCCRARRCSRTGPVRGS
ncbi:hypothetical protein GCM10018980_19870 [Streptomyces capoamus]|uniref:Uncharacterized protein n=1 Tax=Streptomyces capoamus TaxID=68183 RepID=A0A919C2P5_9ACTN|nr:hypothetical protein GCM10010501_33470 [Streptomyces libani subsp. rufus]GHG43155.1 hypothetical protein GCM10018980_19870 [Streptomyces capoamus]